MNRVHLVPICARDSSAWIRMPPVPETALWLRFETARKLVTEALARRGEPFVITVDWMPYQLARRALRPQHPYERPHHSSIHSGVVCSNCTDLDEREREANDRVLEDAEYEQKVADERAGIVHPTRDDPFAQDRSEDLREAVPSMTIENHDECSNCGRDFILTKHQTLRALVSNDFLLCPECQNLDLG